MMKLALKGYVNNFLFYVDDSAWVICSKTKYDQDSVDIFNKEYLKVFNSLLSNNEGITYFDLVAEAIRKTIRIMNKKKGNGYWHKFRCYHESYSGKLTFYDVNDENWELVINL